jgi:hypothetical protein
MRAYFLSAAAAAVLSILTAGASAAVVANYRNDFKTNGTPAPGWSYSWNANGPVGDASTYVPLVADTNFGGDYETQANGTRPDAAPGSSLAATSTSLFPGQGTTQAADGIERYAIAGYTFTAADIAAAGNVGYLDDYHFIVPIDSVDGVNTRVYINNFLIVETILPPGLDYNSSFPGAYPVPLGNISPGDTVYVAVSARGSDTGDELQLEYSLKLVPEPGTLSALGAIACGLLARRRR